MVINSKVVTKRIYDQQSIDTKINKLTSKFNDLISLDDFNSLGDYLNESNYLCKHKDCLIESITNDFDIFNNYSKLLVIIIIYNKELLEEANYISDSLKTLFKKIDFKLLILLNDQDNGDLVDKLLIPYRKNDIDVSIYTKAKIYIEDEYLFKEYIDNSNLILTKYLGTNDQIDIPELINGKHVVGFDFTILQNKQLTNVKIPHHINEVFWNNSLVKSEVKELIFNNNIEMSPLYLESSKSLERLVIPPNLKRIPSKSLRSHKNLKYLVLPDSLEEIGYGALEYLNNLKCLELPESLKIIKEGGLPRESSNFSKLVIKSKELTVSKSVIESLRDVDVYIDKDSSISIYNDSTMEAEQVFSGKEFYKFKGFSTKENKNQKKGV